MSKTIPNFLTVFESKLDKLKNRIDEELKKPKSERRKSSLKFMLKEAKSLKKVINDIRKEHSRKCPHCGNEI